MKITKELIESMVREQLEENLGARAVSTFKRAMSIPRNEKALSDIRNILNSQGEAGASSRREELVALFNTLGINMTDLVKIVGAMRGEERAEATADAAEAPEM